MVQAATKEAPSGIAGGREGTGHFPLAKPIFVAFVVDGWYSLVAKSEVLARWWPQNHPLNGRVELVFIILFNS